MGILKISEDVQINYFLGFLLMTVVGLFLVSLIGIVVLTPLFGCFVVAATLFYAFVVYPSIVFMFQRTEPQRSSQSTKRVTVLVPAHNEQELIVQKVANCLDQSYPTELLDVVIVDDGSTDETLKRLSEANFSKAMIIRRQERGGKSSALADGIKAARGEIIVLTDANVFFDRKAVENLVAALSGDRFSCVTGNVSLISPTSHSLNAESTYQGFESKLLYLESKMNTAICVDGGMYAIYKTAISIPPRGTILDDFSISVSLINAGLKIGFAPDASAKECSSAGIRDEFQRRTRLAEGSIQTLKRGVFPYPWRFVAFWQFVSHKLLRWMAPFLAMLLIAALANLATENQTALFCLAVSLLVISIAFIGLIFPQFRRVRAIGILSYALLVQVAIVFGTFRGLLRNSNPKWQHGKRFPV